MSDSEPLDPLDAGLRIARALEERAVPYALGGALAYGIWAIPRATVDVDLNVFVTNDQLGLVFDALESLGIAVERKSATEGAANRGMFAVRYGLYRVDVFTPSIDFAWEAARTRSAQAIEGEVVYFLSAEALTVFKLLFFRGKDIVDLERLLAVQGAKLDHGYVRAWLVDMMGGDDERVKRWDAMVAANSAQ